MNRQSFASRLRPLAAALLVVSTVAALPGCGAVLVGGAAMGGLAASDRRSVGIQVEDQNIELKVSRQIGQRFGDGAHVNVNSYDRQVLLTGEVSTEAARAEVERIAINVENVRGVVNETVVGPASSLRTRTNDSVITGKVKATLIDAKDLFANAFRVTTERGVVYLQGRLTQREADSGARLVSTIPGVLKVVKVFDIISEQELQSMSNVRAERTESQRTQPGGPQ